MNLIQLNAARLSTHRCWEITRTTMRVDPRCRQQALLQQYADELFVQFQIMHGMYSETQQPTKALRHKSHAMLLGVMSPFLVAAYGNGYRDVAAVTDLKFRPSDLDVLSRSAQARAAYSADVMVTTTEERIAKLDQQADSGDDIGTDLGSDNWLFSRGRAGAATDFEGVRGYRTGLETLLRGSGGSGNGTLEGGGWRKVWSIDPTGHDRDDICDDNEAVGPIALGETFPSGDQSDPAHPNCLCSVYYTRD